MLKMSIKQYLRFDLFTMWDKIHGVGSAESAKAQLDWQCYYNVKKGSIFSRDKTWTNATKMGPQEWYEMYVRPLYPDLALVGMRVLAQVMSASSCERNWSAHGHIHSEERNRLAPATTEKLCSFIPIGRQQQRRLVITS